MGDLLRAFFSSKLKAGSPFLKMGSWENEIDTFDDSCGQLVSWLLPG